MLRKAALKNNPQFYQGDADTAMKGLAGAGGWVPGGYLVKHAIVYPTVGAALGALGGGVSGYSGAGKGEDPWLRAGSAPSSMGLEAWLRAMVCPGSRITWSTGLLPRRARR